MERKEFFITSGMLITAAMMTACAIDSDGAISKECEKDIKNSRPDPLKFREPILKAITLGINAPNPHNTQAWKFKIISDKQALLYVDEKKILPDTDPLARQIHIGCGSFVAVFRMGASSIGYEAAVDYLPEGEYNFNEIGKKPVARLTLEPSNKKADILFQHVYARQTNRGIYEGNLVTRAELNLITSLSLPSHTQIQLHNDQSTLPSLLELLYKGMEVECFDWNAYDESRQWLRVKDDIEIKRDGINMRTGGMTGFKRWIAETMMSGYSKKTWHNKNGIHIYLDNYYEVVMSSKGVVTFITGANNLLDWFICGEDYARFQFAAFDQGFFIHPMSQVLQEFPSMKKLYDEFNTRMNVEIPAKVQMAVRIGRGKLLEYSYRRNTNDLIV